MSSHEIHPKRARVGNLFAVFVELKYDISQPLPLLWCSHYFVMLDHALISVNLSPSGQNGRNLTDIFLCIFMNENLEWNFTEVYS